jgi:hypothetical protein
LKHLTRKWDIEGSVLPALEDVARTLSAITRERRELVESDKPFREVAALLPELETRENEAWKKLEKLGVDKNRDVSAIGETWRGISKSTLALLGTLSPDFKAAIEEESLEDGDSDEEEEEDEEPGLGEKIVNGIGDGICAGIEKAADIICAPFEWMTDKLMGL